MRFDAILCGKKLCFLGVLRSASSLAPTASRTEAVTNGAVSQCRSTPSLARHCSLADVPEDTVPRLVSSSGNDCLDICCQ